MKLKTLPLVSAVALMAAAPAFAQDSGENTEPTDASAGLMATAATDLNMRSGPGSTYEVVDVIPGDESATVEGCLDQVRWCEVTFDGTTGWAYAEYLAVQADDDQYVALSTQPKSVTVNTVTYEDEDATKTKQNIGAAAGGTIGTLIGAAAGGPVGAAVAGGILGTAAGASAVEPVEKTVTYVQENPVDPVYLDGEVVVGAAVPQEVETYTIPDADYDYVNVNGQNVLVDSDGKIVAILR